MIAQRDPEKALAGLRYDEQDDQYLMNAVVKKWAESSPEHAKAWALENPDALTADGVRYVARNLALQVGVESLEPVYRAWADNPEHQDVVARAAIARLLNSDLEKSSAWMDRINDRQLQQRAGEQVLYELGLEAGFEAHIEFIDHVFRDKADARDDLIISTVERFREAGDRQVERYLEALAQSDPGRTVELQRRVSVQP